MFYAEASERLSSLCGTVSSYGTARTRALLDEIGSPDDALRIVHVAGTNGKGSVCAMLSAVLREAGHSTGVFTSPAVLSYAERFTERTGLAPEYSLFTGSLYVQIELTFDRISNIFVYRADSETSGILAADEEAYNMQISYLGPNLGSMPTGYTKVSSFYKG